MMVMMLLWWGLAMAVLLLLVGCQWQALKSVWLRKVGYEAHNFPTNSFELMSAVRIENKNLAFSFGPKDALFQVVFLLNPFFPFIR